MSSDTYLTTSDGSPMQLVRVSPTHGDGPWPALIFCMDAGGLRPELTEMAQRIADESGVVVFMPDLFFRLGSIYDLLPPGTPRTMASFGGFLQTPGARELWASRFQRPATALAYLQDIGEVVLAAIDADPQVVPGPVAVTGYCIGGHVALKLAALLARVDTCACFHGGAIVSDQPDSPHRLADRMHARVYIGGASADPSYSDAAQVALSEAFTAARLDFTLELYAGRHGFAVPGHPSFDAPSAERHYAVLRELLSARSDS